MTTLEPSSQHQLINFKFSSLIKEAVYHLHFIAS